MKEQFELPPMDTAYFCDGGIMTLGEMLYGLDPEFIPTTQEDFDMLMFCFGEGVAETPLEQKLGITVS